MLSVHLDPAHYFIHRLPLNFPQMGISRKVQRPNYSYYSEKENDKKMGNNPPDANIQSAEIKLKITTGIIYIIRLKNLIIILVAFYYRFNFFLFL